jgi:hypothetical protein
MNECDLHCGVPFGFPNFFLILLEINVPEKVVKLVDCNNCKYKCTKNITKDRGEEYLNYFGRLNRM